VQFCSHIQHGLSTLATQVNIKEPVVVTLLLVLDFYADAVDATQAMHACT